MNMTCKSCSIITYFVCFIYKIVAPILQYIKIEYLFGEKSFFNLSPKKNFVCNPKQVVLLFEIRL